MPSPMDTAGPFIPFEKPVPVPLVAADASPLSRICFNSGWSPMVVGALKVLCRPETYDGTTLEINAASRSAHEIIASLETGCGCEPDCSPVNFQFFDGYQGHSNSGGVTWFPEYPNFCSSGPRLMAGWTRLVSGLADMCLRFRSKATNDIVGLNVKQVKLSVSDGTLTPVWQVAYEDCALGPQFLSPLGGTVTLTNLHCSRLAISCLGAFSWTIYVDGPILCEPA